MYRHVINDKLTLLLKIIKIFMPTRSDPDQERYCGSDQAKKFRILPEKAALLKVPSHQIRSAQKWYGWTGSHGYKTADGQQNFKTYLRFVNLN
jgi:hypothetical protein